MRRSCIAGPLLCYMAGCRTGRGALWAGLTGPRRAGGAPLTHRALIILRRQRFGDVHAAQERATRLAGDVDLGLSELSPANLAVARKRVLESAFLQVHHDAAARGRGRENDTGCPLRDHRLPVPLSGLCSAQVQVRGSAQTWRWRTGWSLKWRSRWPRRRWFCRPRLVG